MKKKYFFPLILALFIACKTGKNVSSGVSPKDQYPTLFKDVQAQRVFEDSKTFVDCTPKTDPKKIEREYLSQKNEADFDLKSFVNQHFIIPSSASNNYKSDVQEGVVAHIEELWRILERKPDTASRYSSLIPLPNSYVVPGGRFREIYYWDSYFTMLGLEESGRVDLIEDMVNNFAHLINEVGFIPNGNRTYYLTRSQPPYFSLMVRLLMRNKAGKSDSVLAANRDELKEEYDFWMAGAGIDKGVSKHVVVMPDGSKLNRYADAGTWPREEAYLEDTETAKKSGRPVEAVYKELRSAAESGWDFSSRWFRDSKSLNTIRVTEIVPVDLNCLLYHLETLLSQAYKNESQTKSEEYAKKAEQRKNAILKYCWDSKDGWFKDYDWVNQVQSPENTLAGTFPLFSEIAGPGKADSVAVYLRKHFLKPGGLVTSLKDTGEQWDAPNGWAPLQWIAIAGLANYKSDLAKEAAVNWMKLNINVFNRTGKLLEKYNVADTTLLAGGGEYANQDGFGWTNGVLLKLIHLYGMPEQKGK